MFLSYYYYLILFVCLHVPSNMVERTVWEEVCLYCIEFWMLIQQKLTHPGLLFSVLEGWDKEYTFFLYKERLWWGWGWSSLLVPYFLCSLVFFRAFFNLQFLIKVFLIKKRRVTQKGKRIRWTEQVLLVEYCFPSILYSDKQSN